MPEQTKNTSVCLLVLANALVVVMAIVGHWPLANILWVYWSQSVIIGLFQVARMLFYWPKDINEIRVDPRYNWSQERTVWTGKLVMTAFFIVHYGLFHVVYFIFLSGIFISSLKVFPIIWPAVLVFAVNHLISLLSDSDERSASIGRLFTTPYMRIFPMHMIIMAGALLFYLPGLSYLTKDAIGIVLFSGLKTFADVIGHNIKHQIGSR